MAYGIVTWFDPERGVGSISRAGFVSRDHGGAAIAVHHAQVITIGIKAGDRVRFTLQPDATGLRAVDVQAA